MKRDEILKRLDRSTLTEFQKRVLIATLSIKRGETRSYKEIAKQVGSRNAYRAVGSALKRNPLPIIIPCHRVIKSDGSPGNYNTGGTKRKIELLRGEARKR
jgi:methylated-DNA-[protein]-cysteine S-methyltransferase